MYKHLMHGINYTIGQLIFKDKKFRGFCGQSLNREINILVWQPAFPPTALIDWKLYAPAAWLASDYYSIYIRWAEK